MTHEKEAREQIDPCPFCGHVGLDFVDGSTYRWGLASCSGCGATAGEVRREYPDTGEWRATAIAEWNKRASPPVQAREQAKAVASKDCPHRFPGGCGKDGPCYFPSCMPKQPAPAEQAKPSAGGELRMGGRMQVKPDYSDMSKEALERVAERMAQLLDDNRPIEFHRRHAFGSKSMPSCLCCGKLPEEIAIRHMELPDILICKACRDAALAPPEQQASVPEAFDITLDEEATKLLAQTITGGDTDPENWMPVRLIYGPMHSMDGVGHGLYVCSADYPEEGAILLTPTPSQGAAPDGDSHE